MIVSLLSPGRTAAAAGVAAFALTVIAWTRRAPGASSLGILFVTCLALALAGFGPQQVVFGLQAVAFAALHFRAGFPRGLVGVGLTFMYGLVLGALRRRAGGLMAPFVTHVLTDMVIVTIVLALVRA